MTDLITKIAEKQRVANEFYERHQWASVKRRLPKDEQMALTYDVDGGFFEIAYYDRKDRAWINGNNCAVYPTHWIPIPAPLPEVSND